MMKYVISKHGDIVIFSPTIDHADMKQIVHGTIESAGFVDVSIDKSNKIKVRVEGRSVSLGGIAIRKSDEELIARKLQPDYA